MSGVINASVDWSCVPDGEARCDYTIPLGHTGPGGEDMVPVRLDADGSVRISSAGNAEGETSIANGATETIFTGAKTLVALSATSIANLIEVYDNDTLIWVLGSGLPAMPPVKITNSLKVKNTGLSTVKVYAITI